MFGQRRCSTRSGAVPDHGTITPPCFLPTPPTRKMISTFDLFRRLTRAGADSSTKGLVLGQDLKRDFGRFFFGRSLFNQDQLEKLGQIWGRFRADLGQIF